MATTTSGRDQQPGAIERRPLARLRAQVALPAPTAAWVLTTHALTLATPVVLLVVAWREQAALATVLAHDAALPVAAALVLAGSAFEIAQNTEDRWYYRGPYPALADFAFTVSIAAGLGALAVAASGAWWSWAGAVAAVGVALAVYATGRPAFAALGLAGVTATAAILDATGHWGVVLLLVTNGFLNAVLLDAVVRTGAQSLHGAIALANGLGTLVVAWVLVDAAAGRAAGPGPIAAATVVAVAATLAARPRLLRLRPTPRP